MNRKKISPRRIWKLILDALLLLSLTACNEGCEPEMWEVVVTNHSNQAVSASILGHESSNKSPFEIIAPGESRSMAASEAVYTVQIQPVTDWLDYAKKLEAKLSDEFASYKRDQDPKEIAKELRTLRRRIDDYHKAAKTVSCQGLVGISAGQVYVNDGETANSLRVTCIVPEK